MAVPVPGSIQWNSGRRPTKTWPLRVKEIELKRQKLERADSRLRRRYGTRWPKGLLNCFVERERALNAELEQVVYDEEDRFEPWFPVAIVRALDDALVEVTLESTPQLLEDLWKATHMLVSKRENRKRGIPVLTTAQARQLKKIKNAADRLTMACGPDWPDVEATKGLIGNWAEAGLLNGQTLEGVVNSVNVLSMEIGSRLFDRSTVRHRKPDHAMKTFCSAVAIALHTAGEPVKVHRDSSLARILRILLASAGERVPRDIVRHMAASSKNIAKVLKQRAERDAILAKYLAKAVSQ